MLSVSAAKLTAISPVALIFNFLSRQYIKVYLVVVFYNNVRILTFINTFKFTSLVIKKPGKSMKSAFQPISDSLRVSEFRRMIRGDVNQYRMISTKSIANSIPILSNCTEGAAEHYIVHRGVLGNGVCHVWDLKIKEFGVSFFSSSKLTLLVLRSHFWLEKKSRNGLLYPRPFAMTQSTKRWRSNPFPSITSLQLFTWTSQASFSSCLRVCFWKLINIGWYVQPRHKLGRYIGRPKTHTRSFIQHSTYELAGSTGHWPYGLRSGICIESDWACLVGLREFSLVLIKQIKIFFPPKMFEAFNVQLKKYVNFIVFDLPAKNVWKLEFPAKNCLNIWISNSKNVWKIENFCPKLLGNLNFLPIMVWNCWISN